MVSVLPEEAGWATDRLLGSSMVMFVCSRRRLRGRSARECCTGGGEGVVLRGRQVPVALRPLDHRIQPVAQRLHPIVGLVLLLRRDVEQVVDLEPEQATD